MIGWFGQLEIIYMKKTIFQPETEKYQPEIIPGRKFFGSKCKRNTVGRWGVRVIFQLEIKKNEKKIIFF